MSKKAMTSALRVTKALADAQRLRILMLLRDGELCVCQIVEVLALAPSTVSKHLSLLSSAGLVEMRKEGRWAYYRLPEGEAAEEARPLREWLDRVLEDDGMIEQDRAALKEVMAIDQCDIARNQRCR